MPNSNLGQNASAAQFSLSDLSPFEGPDRTVEVTRAQGVHVKFENGWVVSVQWSPACYVTVRVWDRSDWDYGQPAPDSPTAEVAAWKGKGDMIALDGDSVAGWQPMPHVQAALEAASRDDEDGIRAALTREDHDAE